MNPFPRRALTLVLSGFLIFTALTAPVGGATKPSRATGVAISADVSTATITWKKSANTSYYRVCLREFLKQSPCKHVSASTTGTTARFTGLKPTGGTDYYAQVLSYNKTARTDTVAKGFNLAAPSTKPARPTGVTRAVTTNSLTVTWDAASHAATYDVCLMTNLTTTTCKYRSPRSASLSATFDKLVPTGGVDYVVQVFAYNASGSSYSFRYGVNLPVGPVATITVRQEAGTKQVHNEWTPATNAENYELQYAADQTMASDVRTFTSSEASMTLTQLPVGADYYYRVRGVNGDAKGAWTTATRIHIIANATDVTVATYNLCGQDKCVTTANKMKKWTTRKAIAGKIARDMDADVIATQESHDKDTRFGTELPGFTLAAYYSAKSLFYRTTKYDKLKAGVITLNSTERKYAVWAQLRDRTTGSVFFVSDAHLQSRKGATNDAMREAQTKKLLSGIASVNPDGDPVIHAGDFNSNKDNANQSKYKGGYDAPLKVFTAAGIPDSFNTAKAKGSHWTWNSANQAKNPPLKHSDHVDHVFVDAQIEVRLWEVVTSVDGANYKTPFATDHNPVRVELTIPAR